MKKYQNTAEKRGFTAEYLQFEEGETKELTVSDWTFGNFPSGYLFKCYVIKEGGEEADKIWTIWDYDSILKLKKILGVKYSNTPKDVKVKMVLNEDDENCFEFL